MNYLIFDIETGGLSTEELEKVMPEFTAPGNYKKQESIDAYILESKESYLSGIGAPLSAVTGYVSALGYCIFNDITKQFSKIDIIIGNEIDILNKWWELYKNNDYVVGFNSNYFDIPFMIRRSWKHNIKIPKMFNGRYIDSKCIDLMTVWSCGTLEKIKLDRIAKYFGISGKNGDGSKFTDLLNNPNTKQLALDYLYNDVYITQVVANKLLQLTI
jgi:uncharacterized protein YprB with RNaseH-like and TPR domain